MTKTEELLGGTGGMTATEALSGEGGMATMEKVESAGGGEEPLQVKVPVLDDNVICMIACRLPTRAAYRFTALAQPYRHFVSQPLFLENHLSPRPLLVGDHPDAIVIQPSSQQLGYTHLTLVKINYSTGPAVFYNLPLQIKDESYTYPYPGAEPAPAFFQHTVRLLDMSIVASHDRLLLGRSPDHYFVCNPADDRCLKIPPPIVVKPRGETAAGLYYDLDAASGRVNFTLVVLVRRHRRRLLVQTFKSKVGEWHMNDLGVHCAARCLGPESPGIYAGTSFYWMSQCPRRIICYNLVSGRAGVVREPPEAEQYSRRIGRSLGSTGGRLRMCTFDVGGEQYGLEVRKIGGLLSVWEMEHNGAWKKIHEVLVSDVYWVYEVFRGCHLPMDFAGASQRRIVVKMDKSVLALRDLVTGDMMFLTNLYFGHCGDLHRLYKSCDVFPVFK